METRSKAKITGAKFQPRATSAGGTQPRIEYLTSSTNVNSPSSATGHTRGGKHPSRSSSLEGGPRRTYSHVPRSESTGGASGSPEGNPPRRRGQIGEGGDAGGGLVFYHDLETGIAESGTFHHTPDEGATFILVTKLGETVDSL